jgi:hypothetical protein
MEGRGVTPIRLRQLDILVFVPILWYVPKGEGTLGNWVTVFDL